MPHGDPKSSARPVAVAEIADIPWHVATHAVELARALFGAQVVALFQLADGAPRLLASHGITQATLALLPAWTRTRSIPDLRPWPSGSAEQPAMMLACADDGGVTGLVYLEGHTVCHPACMPALLPFGRVVARLLRGVIDRDKEATMDAASTDTEVEGARLYMLMETHEWNVSRVARELGLTRMTIYNRLRRAGLTRKRVSKARGPHPDGAAATASATSSEGPAMPVAGTPQSARGE